MRHNRIVGNVVPPVVFINPVGLPEASTLDRKLFLRFLIYRCFLNLWRTYNVLFCTTCLFSIQFFNLTFVFAINILLYILCFKLKVLVKADFCVSRIYVYALCCSFLTSQRNPVCWFKVVIRI